MAMLYYNLQQMNKLEYLVCIVLFFVFPLLKIDTRHRELGLEFELQV